MPEEQKTVVYPYIPNSAPQVKAEMLEKIGVKSVEELYVEIPDNLRFKRKLNIPGPMLSEQDVRRHVKSLLNKNTSCEEAINFLGAGTWQHYVPAVCDEINSRGEFVTAYVGHQYSDHGKYQAQFEAQSMIGELTGFDVVSSAIYDWSTAASTSILIGARIAGRREVLVPKALNPEKRLQMKNFLMRSADVKEYNYDPKTGKADLNDLKGKLSSNTGAVYVENTNYFGIIDDSVGEICNLAHGAGAQAVVGADAITLGVLEAPGNYGADLACGELQSLGIHMQFGGGVSGFIACRDEERYVAEIPSLLYGIWSTTEPGEYGFGWSLFDRTSYVKRELANDFTGTTTALWFLTAGVYLALMGPQGLREIGEVCMSRSQYAMKKLAGVKGVKVPFASMPFKEFVVNFDGTGKKVADINKALLAKGIFGGKDISKEFPELGQSALYCVTESISKDNIDTLVAALGEVVR